jgi:hypothetical protein
LTFIGSLLLGRVNGRHRGRQCTGNLGQLPHLHRVAPFPSNDHKGEMRDGCRTLQVLQSLATQQ